MKNYLILCVLLLTGCASAGMNSMCGHINGTGVTIPYVGGRADGQAVYCHVGCFGMNCPKANYADLTQMTSDYIKSTNGLTLTVPATVTVKPSN